MEISNTLEMLDEHLGNKCRLIEPAYPFSPAIQWYGNDNAVFKYQFPTLDCAARILLNNIAQRRKNIFRATILECVNKRTDDIVVI